MNIWIINHYAIPPSLGGLVRHYYFSKFLGQKGHDVKIFTSSEIHNTDVNFITDRSLYKEQDIDGIKYTFVRTSNYTGNGLSRIFNMLEFPMRIWSATKKFARPDIIYTSAPTIFTALSAVLIAKKYKVPCIMEVRDIWPESIVEYKGMSRKNPVILILYQLEKWLYRNADRLIFTMEGGYDYIKEKKWDKIIDKSKVGNVNNGVDLEEFRYNVENYTLQDQDLLDTNSFKVVYTGSIRLVNNLGHVVEMAKYLQEHGENNIKFIIYGDGTEREELSKRCMEEKLQNIVFKGKIDKKYIPFILTHGDLNLNHVKQTNIMRFGCSLNKLFDYFASGKPVLSDLVVNYDLIEKYKAGVTLKSQDIQKICEEIVRFAKMTEEEYIEFSNNALRAANDYNYTVLSDNLERELEQCIVDYHKKKQGR